MGLFDDVEVIDYPLPNGIKRDGFQTKSLDCLMDRYEIRADGSLWRRSGWLRSDDPEPVVERMTWTGEMRFYDWDPDKDPKWVEFVAVFHDGRVRRIKRLPDIDAR